MERIAAVGKQFLTLQDEQGRTDPWLFEHSDRVARAALNIARLPEVREEQPDLAALTIAALFHDAGWAVQFRQGRLDRWQVLSRPTNDVQRELAAGLLQEQIGHLAPANVLRLAADAIRSFTDREAETVEARILSDANNLDDFGVPYILRQFRQYQSEGRTLDQLLSSWSRQQEYRYWEARINDGFHFETPRAAARRRLGSMEAVLATLARDLSAADLESEPAAPEAMVSAAG